jgi:hypothetical protein
MAENGNCGPDEGAGPAPITRALEAAEQVRLRIAIAARGARAVAAEIGISVDAMTLAGAGGNARGGTCAAIRVWLLGRPQ